MAISNKISEYLAEVVAEIRWQAVRPQIKEELEGHICEQREAYILAGFDEDVATDKAIEQMGQANVIGLGLDRVNRPASQKWLLIFGMGLILLGFLLQLVISVNVENYYDISFFNYAIACAIMFIAYKFDFSFLGLYARKIYFAILAFSVVFYFYLDYMFYSGVLGDYLPLTYPIAFALLIYSLRGRGIKGVLITLAGIVPFYLLLSYENDLLGFAFFAFVGFGVFCFALWENWFKISKKEAIFSLVGFGLIMFACLFFLVNSAYYLLDVFKAWLDPYTYAQSSGYVFVLMREVFASCNFIGSMSSAGTMPDLGIYDYSDFLFSGTNYSLVALSSLYGLIVFAGVVLALTILTILLFRKVMKEKSFLARLIGFSIVFSIALQVLLSIFENLGYGLFNSYGMPFITYGTTAMWVNALMLGFLLSIFRSGQVYRDRVLVEEIS